MVVKPATNGTTPPKRRAGKSDEILAAFIRHVADRGYAHTNMAALADELGIAQGTIVYHFGSKAQMLRDVEERYMRGEIEQLQRIWSRLRAPEERIAALIWRAALLQVIDRDATIATQREIVQLADDPEMREIRRLRKEMQDMLRRELELGMVAGVFRDVDAGVVTLQIFGSLQWMWTWFDPEGGRTADEIAASFVDVFLGGLMSDRADLVRLADPVGDIAATARESAAVAG